MAEFVAAIDQGTTSTRCMIFDHDGAEVARHQLEHDSGDRPVQPEQPSHPVEGSDGRALLAFYVVAIDVFRKVGLQLTVEPRRIRAAPWHGLDIQFGRH